MNYKARTLVSDPVWVPEHNHHKAYQGSFGLVNRLLVLRYIACTHPPLFSVGSVRTLGGLYLSLVLIVLACHLIRGTDL